MSIKFPDFQVLVSRSDQIPKVSREGDQNGAGGKMAPQVSAQFAAREKRVEQNQTRDHIEDGNEEERRRKRQNSDKEEKQKQEQSQERARRLGPKRRIDLRA